MGARLGAINMNPIDVNYQTVPNRQQTKARFTPEALEAHAQALQNVSESDFSVDPILIADVLDGRLKKTKSGRKLVNLLVSGASFAAAVVSFKKVSPKLRNGISNATSKIAGSFGNVGKKINSKNISDVADEMTKEAAKIAQKGDGSVLRRGITEVLGEEKGAKALDVLSKFGINTGGDAADTAIAVGAAVLAGREAGDIADDTQKDLTLKDAVRDITRVMNAIPGADVIGEI